MGLLPFASTFVQFSAEKRALGISFRKKIGTYMYMYYLNILILYICTPFFVQIVSIPSSLSFVDFGFFLGGGGCFW